MIGRLVGALSDELGIDVEPLGATTLKLELREKGAEPDDAFYVQNAPLVVTKEELDLQHDPPPDVVLESDHTSSSLDEFSIYAGLGVPEIWRISRRRIQIYLLEGSNYQESATSRAFPFLTPDTINTFLEQGIKQGASAAARAFRDWLRQHPQTIS